MHVWGSMLGHLGDLSLTSVISDGLVVKHPQMLTLIELSYLGVTLLLGGVGAMYLH
ncbi:hypothetical protein SDC9_145734 [bioreactor metagenome]|uniref:Uncharacterized protein n=1 Tax=bioreactor metagenome TaxID=1076179 RepID=A0A645EA87_9ZZZZ